MATTIIHNFAASKARGEEVEAQLDAYLEPTYIIRKASEAEQRRGIDRWLTHRETGDTLSIDYKADHLAARTGNAFIETVSVDSAGKGGWALTSQADLIFYYLPQRSTLYVLSMAEISRALPQWADLYRQVHAQNEGYQSAGVLVPLKEIERIAEDVVEVGE